MKTKIVPILAAAALLSSCTESVYREYQGNDPVYLSYEELRSSVAVESGHSLDSPGKIYFKDNYIFIIDNLKGFHVYDNSNPAAPVHKTFVKVPGAVDISVTGYIIYVDSYVDLVVLDAEDISNIHEVGRVKDVFPYLIPDPVNEYPVGNVDKEKGVVTGYEVRMIREKVQPYYNRYPVMWENMTDKFNGGMASPGVSGSGVGVGGSMARFGIKGNVLYAVDQTSINVFDISDRVNPKKFSTVGAGWGVETMFLTDSYMFLGTTTGVVIFSTSIPLSPSYVTFISHFRSCDPVVVDGNVAYSTLRSGTTCGNNAANRLDVYDISSITSPKLLQTYPMTNPYGLAKDGNLLFVCDGTSGLKIYDATDNMRITQHLLYTYPALKAYDVIPLGSVLIMIGDDGLYQYDYSNPAAIMMISHIPIAFKPD